MIILPKVSICVPTYNGREHLAECLTSICAQTFTNFEVVVCDDDSSDGTLAYARELVQGDVRFRFIANPRRFGLVGNWNHCIRQTRGEWIKFVFQDDIIRPACLEKLLAACERVRKPFGFCERDFLFDESVPPEQRDWFARHQERLRSDYQSGATVEPELIAHLAAQHPLHNPVGEPTVTLIHRSLFSELGKFDEALIQVPDVEFWNRAMVNRGGVFVPESLAWFRIHAKATTALNLSRREFRTAKVDPLVMLNRVTWSRHFRFARQIRFTGKSQWSQWRESAVASSRVWRQVRQSTVAGDGALLAEWQSASCADRTLQWLALLGWLCDLPGRARRGFKRRGFFLRN